MAVREVFCGGEMDSWRMVEGAALVGLGDFDPAFSASSLNVFVPRRYRADFIDASGSPTSIPNGETVHGMFYMRKADNANATFKALLDVNGRPTYRIAGVPDGETLAIQQNTSTNSTPNWQTICSTRAFSSSAGTYVAYYIDTGAKEAALFTNGNFAASGSFSSTHSAALSSVELGPAGQQCWISQVLVTENLPTVGARVWTRKAAANGAVQEMTGSYTALNKTDLNDTTSVLSVAAGQTSTFVYQDIAELAGMKVGEVWVWNRAQNDGASPTNLKAVARLGSTNYTTADMSGMMVGFNAVAGRFPVNPATSAPWTVAAFNGAEIGLQSAA